MENIKSTTWFHDYRPKRGYLRNVVFIMIEKLGSPITQKGIGLQNFPHTLRSNSIIAPVLPWHGLRSRPGVHLMWSIHPRRSHGACMRMREGLELHRLGRIHFLTEAQQMEGGVWANFIIHALEHIQIREFLGLIIRNWKGCDAMRMTHVQNRTCKYCTYVLFGCC